MIGADFDVDAYGLRPMPWATIQTLTPANCEGKFFYCPDAPGGKALILCDGVAFRAFARGTQSKILTTDAAGKVTWTFQLPFATGVVPCVLFGLVNSATYVLDVSMDGDPTNTQAKFMVRQSQNVPQNLATLLLSASYNIFGSTANISGVKIHATAFVPNNS
ncbi:hypothetical protein [Sphingobium yanoikuyae]|uniref:hypothetical protein n=1 Tax=Sphingobium yanoikuyae TaxID=13690 RepID=UPI00345E6B29